MSTAITALQRNGAQLSELEELILQEAAGDGAAYDPIPTKLTIAPGGINQYVTSDGETLKSFTAIVAISQKARAYWSEKGTGQPPLCSSSDGARGVFSGAPTTEQLRAALTAKEPHWALKLMDAGAPLPDLYECIACPLSRWGSVHQGGASGKSQACKTLRRLVLLVDGWTQPALLTLPPTSVKGWDAYCSSLSRQRSAYFAVRTKFELKSDKSVNGDPYSMALVTMAEKLTDKAEIQAVISIRREFEALVRSMPIQSTEYDVTDENGEYVDAAGGFGGRGAGEDDEDAPF